MCLTVTASDTGECDAVLRILEGEQPHASPEDAARLLRSVPGGRVLLDGPAPDPVAARIHLPSLREAGQPPTALAPARAVPVLSLSDLGHGGDDLPQDPSAFTYVVLGHLLSGPPQEGHFCAPVSAR